MLVRRKMKGKKRDGETQEKRNYVAKQTNEARKTDFVTIRNGKRIPLYMAFRCLYCGEYYNQAGAEEHFGKTRKKYLSEIR